MGDFSPIPPCVCRFDRVNFGQNLADVMKTDSDTDNNLLRLRAAYSLWAETKGRQYDFWFDLHSNGFVADSIRDDRAGPEYFRAKTRRDELEAYFQALQRNWKMLEFRVEEFIAQGDSIVVRAFSRWENRRTGKQFATKKLDYWRFEGNKVVAYLDTFDTAAMLDAMDPGPNRYASSLARGAM